MKFASAACDQRNRSSFARRNDVLLDGSLAEVGVVESAQDRERRALGLAEDQVGRAGDLVGDRDLGDFEHSPVGVGRAA